MESASRLEQRAHVTLPDTGTVKTSGRRRVWIDGRSLRPLKAGTWARPTPPPAPDSRHVRLRLSDPYAEEPIVYLFATASGCPHGLPDQVLRSAAIDNH